MKIFRFYKSFNSVIFGLAESGNFIPPEIAATMTPQARAYVSPASQLIPLIECTQLRDTGLVATNASPLVIDLTRALPASLSQDDLLSFYRLRTPDQESVYLDNDEFPITSQQHQLRRDIFYQPFFQKLNAELQRVVNQFGAATLITLNCDSQLPSGTIRIANSDAKTDVAALQKFACDEGMELQIIPGNKNHVLPELIQIDGLKTCHVTLSHGVFLDDGKLSEDKAQTVRVLLARWIDGLACSD